MDLFSAITDELETTEDMESKVIAICDFVKGLTPRQLTLIKAVQDTRDFEAWDKAARGLQTFAYKQGLKDQWWEVVELVKTQRKNEFWNAGWDAAFDHSVATLLKPWAGKSYSSKDYELLTSPLKAAGFKE